MSTEQTPPTEAELDEYKRNALLLRAWMERNTKAIDRLVAEVQRRAADSERLDWLQAHGCETWLAREMEWSVAVRTYAGPDSFTLPCFVGATLREAIDAARKEPTR